MRLGVVLDGEVSAAAFIDPSEGRYRLLSECLPHTELPLGAEAVTALLADPELRERAEAGAEGAEGRTLDPRSLRAPVAPTRIVGIGLNYRSHAKEVGREPGDMPAVFLKDIAALNDPFGRCRRPAITDTLDYEAELAVILGAPLYEAEEEAAAAAIGGYAVANDLTLRAFAKPGSLPFAKGFPGACPIGPYVTPAKEIADPAALVVRSFVGGNARQAAPVSEMIFSVPKLLSIASRFLALLPGDVVLTGSPAGSGAGFDPPRWLAPGDVVRAEIGGLGFVETQIV